MTAVDVRPARPSLLALLTTVAALLASLVVAGPARAATTYAQIDSGSMHTCAVGADGSLWCWGVNWYGQLGLGDTTDRDRPTRVGTARNWASVSAGMGTTCALKTDGTRYCWGLNGNGQLGLGDTTNRTAPRRVVDEGPWLSVSVGTAFACGIRADNLLNCWGRNDHGQLGVGDRVDRRVPTVVGRPGWGSVSVGLMSACGLKSGTRYCWGGNEYGQLGLGDRTDRTAPRRLLDGRVWQSVNAEGWGGCGIEVDRSVYCWGRNDVGQLGVGDTLERLVPTRLGSAPYTAVFALGEGESMCGVSGGARYCWGDNANGRLGLGLGLGDGGADLVLRPARGRETTPWVSFTAQVFPGIAYGLDQDGRIWFWTSQTDWTGPRRPQLFQ